MNETEDLTGEWALLLKMIGQKFGDDIDLNGVLFLIGVQELGQGYKQFGKDQKLEVMHIAICTLLEPYGLYEFEGRDADGWPHWKNKEKLTITKQAEQQKLIQKAIIEYFKQNALA